MHKKTGGLSDHLFQCAVYGNFVLLWNGQGVRTAGEPEENLRAELAGVDFLVLHPDRCGMLKSSFY